MTPFLRRPPSRFLSTRKAASLMEFGVVVGLISLLGFGSVVATGGEVRTVFCQATKSVEDAVFGDDSRVCREVADGGEQGGGGDGGGQGGGGGGQGGGGEPPPVTPPGDARYPTSVVVGGVNYVWHVHANHPIGVMPLAPAEPAVVTFAAPYMGGQWDIAVRNMTAQAGTVVLEYNANGTWSTAASLPLGANAQVAQVVPFTAAEAASWRLRVEGTSSASIIESRIGTAADLPPLLPVLDLDPTYAFTFNALETFDLAPSVLNAEAGVVFEFDRASWNGIAFSSNGVMAGTGASVVASPGTPMQVRVRDARNIWSDWFDFTSVIATAATADTRYPATGAAWQSHYSQGASESVVLASGEASEFAFDQVVSVNAWSVLARRESGTFGSSLQLQYQDSLGVWTDVERFSLTSAEGSDPIARTYAFDTVVAQNFRILNTSAAGRSVRVMEGRVGFDAVYPAYLPHIASNIELDIPVTTSSTAELASAVVNAVGPVEFEFTPASRNGLTYNADGTITGLPAAVVTAPGDETTFRFRDSRGLWSRTYTMRVTSTGELVASTVYPVSGTHLADQYGASGKRNTIAANGGTHLLTFPRPIRVSDWQVGISTGSAPADVGVSLQYLNGSGVWTTVDSVVQDRFASGVSLFTRAFDEVSATEFRIRNSSPYAIEVTANRLGHGAAFPALLPHIPAETTRTAQAGSAFTGTYLSAVVNAVGPVEFEFTPSSVNGLTFNADGTVTGTPTSVVSSPGQLVSARLRDSRGVWTTPTNLRMLVTGTVFASTSYPVGGTEALDYYTGGTMSVGINAGASQAITFPNPTTVSSWTATANLGGTGTQRLTVEYRDEAGVWRSAVSGLSNAGSNRVLGGNFAAVTATEFRLTNDGSGGHNITSFRLGHSGQFPPDLPRLATSTVTLAAGEAANFDVASLFANLSGAGTYEFSSTSWNGLTLGTDGRISGTPSTVVPAPGQAFTVRVKDSRDAWSKVFTFRVVVSGALAASSQYPVSGSTASVPVNLYTNDGETVSLTSGNVSFAFAEPITVDSWSFDASISGGASGQVRLEYRNTPTTWAAAGTITLATSTRTERSTSFAAVTSNEFRIVPLVTGRTYNIFHSRVGLGGVYPAFLPHFNEAGAAVALVRGELSAETLEGFVDNEVGPLVFDVSTSGVSGVSFNIDGTVTGRPTAVEANPGRLLTVRVRDSRNIYSLSKNFRLIVHSDVSAGSVYPVSSATVVADHVDDGTFVALSSGTQRAVTYSEPVFVDSWQIRHSSQTASASSFELQYRSATGTWTALSTVSSANATMATNTRTFTGVTATEFRIVSSNPTRLEASRLGVNGAYPAFLPHATAGQTFDATVGVPASFDLGASVSNGAGPVTFAFTPSTLNGLSLNSDGTITGTPTSAPISPMPTVSFTLTDGRGFTTGPFTATVAIASNALASTTYPTGGTGFVAHYTNTDPSTPLTTGDYTYVFAAPVRVDSWAINLSSSSASSIGVRLEYRNAGGGWSTLSTIGIGTTTPTTEQRSFTAVNATEFRIVRASGSATANIFHSRLGFASAYPAFLP